LPWEKATASRRAHASSISLISDRTAGEGTKNQDHPKHLLIASTRSYSAKGGIIDVRYGKKRKSIPRLSFAREDPGCRSSRTAPKRKRSLSSKLERRVAAGQTGGEGATPFLLRRRKISEGGRNGRCRNPPVASWRSASCQKNGAAGKKRSGPERLMLTQKGGEHDLAGGGKARSSPGLCVKKEHKVCGSSKVPASGLETEVPDLTRDFRGKNGRQTL